MKSRKRNITVAVFLLSLVILLDDGRALAQGSAAGDGSKYVTVVAEGSGVTKLEALNSAWGEAVRKAIGLYMVSKTSVINEDIQEQILTYSRGRVNSYKELSAIKNGDIWQVTIEAEIEKEILIETINNYSTTELSVDGLNLAATLSTESDKEKNKTLLLKNFLDDFKFEDLFKITLKPSIEDGQLFIYATIELDLNIYRNLILTKLNDILRQISISTENQFINQEDSACNKLLLNLSYVFDGENQNLDIHCTDFHRGINRFFDKENIVNIYEGDKFSTYFLKKDLYELIVAKYKFYSYIDNPFTVVIITIEALDDNTVIASTTYQKDIFALLGGKRLFSIDILPGLKMGYGRPFGRIMVHKIPFDVDPNTLAKITKFKASFSFKYR
ncbi:MAG: hypothetical protein LBF58_03935 [Deltaproteobacteria bacterium]|jgi:hypothetical protein|nr:hypothetical protein [Deltaproteobacteria bacterium]